MLNRVRLRTLVEWSNSHHDPARDKLCRALDEASAKRTHIMVDGPEVSKAAEHDEDVEDLMEA
jgi:hypothetical protein